MGCSKVLNLSPTAPAPSLLNALSAYWKLDGGSLVNSGNPGTDDLIQQGTTWSSVGAGILNTCFSSGAGTNSSDVLYHPDDANLSAGLGVSFSLQAWVFLAIGGNFSGVFLIGKWTGLNNDFFIGLSIPTKWVFNVQQISNAALLTVDSGILAVTHAWTHLVAGYDDALQEAWIQVNAGPRQSISVSGVWRSAAPFTLGNYGLAGSTRILGSIDECAFWRRSLTTAEVTQLYNSGNALPFPFV